MLQKPRLVERYQALLVEGQGILLLSDRQDHVVPLSLYQQILPLLDGLSTTDQLIERFRGSWSRTAVWCVLWHLERLGCAADGAPRPATAEPVSPVPISDRPAGAWQRVALSLVGALDRGRCEAALQAHGFTPDARAGLDLVLTDSYLRPELAKVNARARRSGRPWLLAKPVGPLIWIGPLFRPDGGCCWSCLEARLRRNRPFEYHLLRHPESARPIAPWPARQDALESGIGALAAEIGDQLADAIVTVDARDGSRHLRRVARRPQCPACGDPGLYGRRAVEPFAPGSRPKRSHDGGASREVSALQTLTVYEGLADPLVGAVHDLQPVERRKGAPLRVYFARHGGEPARDDRPLLERGLERTSGKGVTDAEARAGALGEAIERYCGCFQGDEPRVVASLQDLGGDAVHPNLCMQFSQAQYEAREALDRQSPRWGRVPPPLDPAARIEWTPVWSLTCGRARYLPTMLLYHRYPADGGAAYCVPDPSGAAAGNSREEAVLQGLMELLERDSLALWWYNRIARPAVELGDLGDSLCGGLVPRYRSLGREAWVLDITSDLGVPSFAAVSRRVDIPAEEIVMGFGAHLHPAVALGRALAEMDQVLALIDAPESEGTLGPALERWLREATLANQPYLAPGRLTPVRVSSMPNAATEDIGEDIGLCERLLGRHGMELLVLDQTRPDVQVPVMKVIVPGLRHFRPRFAPGRLYTAPVRAGWVDRPRAEAELNPIGFFL